VAHQNTFTLRLPLQESCDDATSYAVLDDADDYADAMLSIFKSLVLISLFRRLCNCDIISLQGATPRHQHKQRGKLRRSYGKNKIILNNKLLRSYNYEEAGPIRQRE